MIAELQKLNYDLTDEGELEDYLGIQIEKLPIGQLKMSQPQLIQQILQDLGLCSRENQEQRYALKTMQTLATSTVILMREDHDGPTHSEKWNYQSVIGKLNFLEKSMWPKLAYVVHNAARFAADPKQSYSQAVKQIGRYLLGT